MLTYLLARSLMNAGLSFASSLVLLRFVFTTASLFIFHRYLGLWVRPPFALLGLFMLMSLQRRLESGAR